MTPIVALELGTSKICALVGEVREDGHITLIGIGQCPSGGVRKGMIVDLTSVTTCVRAAIQEAERSGNVEIAEVHLALSGGHIQSTVNPGSIAVFNPRQGITSDDMEQVQEIARAIQPRDDQILHTLKQHFTVDGQSGIINPEGMPGARLSLNMLLVRCARNPLDNAVAAVQQAGLEVADVAFSGLCSALAVLTPDQKECGVAVLDLGAGATSLMVFTEGLPAYAHAIGVGGDHVNNDIALGFSISQKRAEQLKKESGCAIVDADTHFQRIAVPSELGFPAGSVAVSDLNMIINARLDELFGMILRDLESRHLLGKLGAGIVLTGGGARLKGVDTLAERIFEIPCTIGKPKDFVGIASAYEGPEYATLLGLIRYAAEGAMAQPARVSLKEMFSNLFNRRR